MSQSYSKYQSSIEWSIVQKAIQDLVNNRDLELTTNVENIVGYISEQLVESKAEINLRTKVLCSGSNALQGAVTQHLRAVTVDYNKHLLTLRAYFDIGATTIDKELIDVALTEMIADLWQEIEECRYEAVDLPFPNKMEGLKEWLYLRYENPGEINYNLAG